ncbi:hypothetical protein AB1Y20_009834 [Prymnesium parvum]|uniref:DUF659 domain-containing protein n=1 Tax=Prymnesium parvum TaxID=97485 RepID=A0AB34K686_PRYPA
MRSHTLGKRVLREAEQSLHQKELDIQEALMKTRKVEERQQGIKAGFSLAECELADKAVAKFFYMNGISFNVAGAGGVDSSFRDMCDAIRKTPTSWIPPNRKKLAGPLIDTCYSEMTKKLEERDADGGFADKFGYSYTQDGWDSVDHLPLINSAYFCAGAGSVYLRSVDTSGKSKDAEYIASLMIADIYDIGCTRVVTVVTDTCATMEKLGKYTDSCDKLRQALKHDTEHAIRELEAAIAR